MIEKIKLVFADGPNILGYYMISAYWTKHFGRQDVEDVFKQLSSNFNDSYFQKIKPLHKKNNWVVDQEHFIIKRISDGQYTIEDRNNPPLTYLNNQLIGNTPVSLQDGAVIAVPLVKNGQDQSCFIQVSFDRKNSKFSPMKQLIQCQKTKKQFIVYWEEDPDSRYHLSTKIEKLIGDPNQFKSQGYKNLRMAAETPCPYCGNKHLIFCSKCNTFICYDGLENKVKCPGCDKKYKLKDMQGNIDIQAF